MVSVVLHAAFLLFVKVDINPIPAEPIVLNMRLVKPVGPLPVPPDEPIDPPQSIVETVQPPVEPTTPNDEDLLNFNEPLFPEDYLPNLDLDIEIPPFEDPVATLNENPIQDMSVEDMVQSIADMAAARNEEENEKRIRRLAGEGTSSIEETFYLRSWLRKVQRVGQMNYPREAVEKKLYGTLSLYVSIAPDGSLVETRVVETSGHEVLDKAAVNIVKLAAPFAPFPAAIARDTDLLEIVREWEFRKGSYTTDPPEKEETQSP